MLHLLTTLLLAVSPSEGVSLDALLERVRTTHPLFTREARRAEIERHARDATLGQEDWVLLATGLFSYTNPAQVSPFSPKEIHNAGFHVGVERSFWTTGGRLGVAWNGGYLRQSYPGFNLGPGVSLPSLLELYESRVQVFYSQPLLRNLAGTLDRLPFDLKTHDIKIAELTAQENQEAFLVQIGARYLDWVLASEQTRIAQRRLNLAEEQLVVAKRKRAANLVDPVEVLRNIDAVQSVHQALVLLESQSKAAREDLSVIAQLVALRDAIPIFEIYATEPIPSPEQATQELLASSRLMQSTRSLRSQTLLRLGAAEEVTAPDLSVDVGVGLLGSDETLGNAFEMAKPEANAMVVFRYPLGNTYAEAELSRNRALLKQIDDSLAETELKLEAIFRGLLVRLHELGRVLEIDRAQIEAASNKATEELKMYNRGRGQLTFVIQAQDSVARAEANHAENAVTYHKLYLQYRELTDRLLAPQS